MKTLTSEQILKLSIVIIIITTIRVADWPINRSAPQTSISIPIQQPLKTTAANDTALLDAICIVESGGDNNAVGDAGTSLGAYQIGKLYWIDATEFGKVDWDYKTDVHDPIKCRQVIRWYWARYLPDDANDEMKARVHNGGPTGHRKKATEKYWNKVKKEMKK